VLESGDIYGTFCCYSTKAGPSLNDKDLAVIRALADVAARCLEDELRANRERDARLDRIRHILDDASQLRVVYQPVVGIRDGALQGLEALARFLLPPNRSPDLWFAEAGSVGLSIDLELHVVQAALAVLPQLPSGAFLSVNVSPQAVLSGRLEEALKAWALDRVVLEITEHAPIPDYKRLDCMLAPLRRRGARLAVDDAGAGYASLRHILWLKPEFIKLDMSITHRLHLDPARAALATAFIEFASKVGSRIIAEGVEEAAELTELARLGADAAQGYYLGRPGDLDDVLVGDASTKNPKFPVSH
jgi:EAL domain-containing protein (putative c-di-GMP-specific phosphodiesterase class I)